MNSFAFYGKKLQHLCSGSWQWTRLFISLCYREILFRTDPFFLQVLYFTSVSYVGFEILKSLNPRTSEFGPRNIDLFFTSVSAVTVSSMSTVEMEVFSNSHLVVLTILMFVGCEVFTSMVGLYLKRSKILRECWKRAGRVDSLQNSTSGPKSPQIELSIVSIPELGFVPHFESHKDIFPSSSKPCFLKYDSVMFLVLVVLCYLLVVLIFGVVSVFLYLSLVPSAKGILRNKGLQTFTFSIFTVVSTFASCGFVPTNENMMVFSKNSGLLWILIPQALLGNTLFPSCLRFLIWILGKKVKKEEANYLLKHTIEVEHLHLLPSLHSKLLVATVFGFISTGFVMFCGLEWNSTGLSGLNAYQKVVGILFQIVNARHTGETIVDLSTLAPAILVFFVVMMYLPPYTSFLPIKKDGDSPIDSCVEIKKNRERVGENLILSQLSYLVMFIILVCIIERKNMKEDPINFSVLNIILEVISAYGNVGFTTGYGCARQLKPDPTCVDKWYGFSGKWSDEGKIVLIVVMFFGRLKKFNMNGGQGWKLL